MHGRSGGGGGGRFLTRRQSQLVGVGALAFILVCLNYAVVRHTSEDLQQHDGESGTNPRKGISEEKRPTRVVKAASSIKRDVAEENVEKSTRSPSLVAPKTEISESIRNADVHKEVKETASPGEAKQEEELVQGKREVLSSKRKSRIPEDHSFAAWNHIPPSSSSSSVYVVIGIPSVDNPSSASRRQLQRGSWHHYRNVYHRERNPKGTVLIKYLIGKHFSHNFRFSSELEEEAKEYGDIVAFDMKEGKPTTAKSAGKGGHWGLEVEVGMSKKALAWYVYAAETFPSVPFISKGDDDYFLRTVEFEATLRGLEETLKATPNKGSGSRSSNNLFNSHGLYWGLVMKWGAKKGDPSSKFSYAGGMSITMSRDHVEWIRTGALGKEEGEDGDNNNGENGRQSSPPYKMHEYMLPFEGLEYKDWYKRSNMDHEDVMVGRMFYDMEHKHTVINDCSFHDVRNGANVRPITSKSIGMHRVREQKEFEDLMKRFPDNNSVVEGGALVAAKELTGFKVESSPNKRGVHFASVQGKAKC